jgi:hypothetical protein
MPPTNDLYLFVFIDLKIGYRGQVNYNIPEAFIPEIFLSIIIDWNDLRLASDEYCLLLLHQHFTPPRLRQQLFSGL